MATKHIIVEDLSVEYLGPTKKIYALQHVSLEIYRGESIALVGESGCGKSTLGVAFIRLLPVNSRITSGRIRFVDGSREINILELSQSELQKIRWSKIVMMAQGALNAFNPVMRIKDHFIDTAYSHGWKNKTEVLKKARYLLERVHLDSERVLNSFPHELSGGMRQRVLLSLGLFLNTEVVILDEPTTALDILTQRNIIELLKELKKEFNFTLIFITHDLSLAAELADRVAVMYAGKIVEVGDVYNIFGTPYHPYTAGLITSTPKLRGKSTEITSIPGSPPNLSEIFKGCPFYERCPLRSNVCLNTPPTLTFVDGQEGHFVACHHASKDTLSKIRQSDWLSTIQK
ncbi:MAG: peptide/nickel transport system ATP-binding protein [Caldanaerobacter sp.]|nr:peptide/nickel transport system ATP-binding protein [Caldanaerobacter sp.]